MLTNFLCTVRRVAQGLLQLSSYETLMGDKEGDAYITGIDCLAIRHECLGNIVPHHIFGTIYGGMGSKSKNPDFFAHAWATRESSHGKLLNASALSLRTGTNRMLSHVSSLSEARSSSITDWDMQLDGCGSESEQVLGSSWSVRK